MTLTTNGKNWIAQNLGISDCMTETSRAFTYHDDLNNNDISDTGGTATMMNRLIDSLCSYVTIAGTIYNASALETANGSMPVYPDDVLWVMANDSGTSQYCYTAAPPPGDRPVTPPLTVYVGGGEACPAGAPDVTLDTAEAFAFFKTDPYTYVGVGEVKVHNISSVCYAYFAWEARIWDGVGFTECPTTTPELQEITRFLADATGGRPISITRLNASETDVVWGTFQVPTTMVGQKTICMSLWGNFDKQALIDELAAAGYVDLL